MKSVQSLKAQNIASAENSIQWVDSAVTYAKYEQELAAFHAANSTHRKRGIILLEASFPNIYIAFCAVQLNPPPIAFAVRFNFDNYDVEPLSITFVDPFSLTPVMIQQMKVHFLRRQSNDANNVNPQRLLVWQDDGIPFLCLPGVREYHHHVAHTGDSWWLHRKKGGEGTMGFLIEKLYTYGIEAMSGYMFSVNFNLNVPSPALEFNRQSIPL
jgi:hypothetical protein